MTFLERLFPSDADQKDIPVMIPSSWAGLIALLVAERKDMSRGQYDDLYVIRQFCAAAAFIDAGFESRI